MLSLLVAGSWSHLRKGPIIFKQDQHNEFTLLSKYILLPEDGSLRAEKCQSETVLIIHACISRFLV